MIDIFCWKPIWVEWCVQSTVVVCATTASVKNKTTNELTKMADADTRINLAALKRVDPYAVEIVETGTQVAIYKFNSQTNEWVMTPY